jgi:SAM-dependent MidA family methyltransferase
VRWCESLEAAGAGVACILSNELIDSFPVHRIQVVGGRLLEIFVAADGDRLAEVRDEPSTPELANCFDRLGLLPGEGCEAEVNLDAQTWAQCAAARLSSGFLLTLDYGYPARTLYAPWRKQGTLLCFYRHTATTDPFAHVGRQDITSHVDFTTFALAGRDAGLEPLGFTSQQRFLSALGIHDALEGGPAAAPSLEEYLARRRAVEALLDPQGLGRIRAFVQGKGVGTPQLCGFPATCEELLQ